MMEPEDKQKAFEAAVNLNNRVFIATREFVDGQYPKLKDNEKVIPIALLTNHVFGSVWGAIFHSEMAKFAKQSNQDLLAAASHVINNIGRKD